MVPAVHFGGMDSRTNIRGLDRGALVLVNGVPMSLNGESALSTSAINIEVVKGAALHCMVQRH